jgi:signal peptidase I
MKQGMNNISEQAETERQGTLKPKKRSRTFFVVFLLIVLAVSGFGLLNFQTVIIQGDSMEPTFYDEQRILVCKALWLMGKPKHNDIVVIKGMRPGEYLVKRVYRLQGEAVEIVYQPYEWSFTKGVYVVPEGHIYVLGDNLENSEDSRSFGAVEESRVIGKVVMF